MVWFLLLFYIYVGFEELMNLFFRVRLYRGFLLVLRRFSWYLFCKKCNVWEMDNENINEIYKISIFLWVVYFLMLVIIMYIEYYCLENYLF